MLLVVVMSSCAVETFLLFYVFGKVFWVDLSLSLHLCSLFDIFYDFVREAPPNTIPALFRLQDLLLLFLLIGWVRINCFDRK